MDSPDDIILLQTFISDADAYIAKGVLETNGIPCIINNEIISNVYPVTLTPWGGIKLLIFRRDLELARQLLGSDEDQTPE